MKNGVFLLGCLFVIACGKSDTPKLLPPTPQAPEAVLLSFPVQDEECTAGTIISDTQSSIPFSWKSAENAESYEIHVKNLESGVSLSETTVQTNLNLTLNRNTPYSWYVISKTSKSNLATTSATWKFYNSGPGKTTYAPFPAEIVSPIMGQKLDAAGKITLDWAGSDVDGDIVNYDVYLGNSQTPGLLKEKVTESILGGVEVGTKTTYFWKIITRDAQGNSSDSGVFVFSVN